MKLVLNLIIAGLGLITLPFSLLGSWLLYDHVQATQLMWFLWWFTSPIVILIALLGAIAKHFLDKEK